MVSGLRLRPFARLIRLSAVAFAGGLLAACSIGLSASSFDSAPYDGGGYDVRLNDASVHDGGGAGFGDTSDAATVVTTPSSNPLCNIDVQNDGGTCDPDFAIAPSGELCQLPDAGAQADSGLAADSGIATGSDASILLACRVAVASGAAQARIQTCGLAGTGGDGDSCETGGDCAPAFECVGMPGRCRHYCCDGDKSCATSKSASFCDIGSTSASNITVPVCAPVSRCKLLTANACGADQTCAVVKEDGTTSCVAVGPAQVGQDCNAVHCGAGLTCLGKPGARPCFKLCRVGYPEDCADGQKSTTCTGSAQLFNDPEYGICQ